MNKTERIKSLNDYVGWTVKYPHTSKTTSFSTYDEIIAWANNQKQFWSNLETGVSGAGLFSSIFTSLIDTVESIQKNITDPIQNSLNTTLNTMNSNREQNGITLISLVQAYQARSIKPMIEITVNAICFVPENAEHLAYAYKEYRLNNDMQGFNDFINLIENRAQLSNLLSNTDTTKSAIAIQYLGVSMEKYKFPSRNKFTEDRLLNIESDIDSSKKRLTDLRSEIESFVQESSANLENELAKRASENAEFKKDIETWKTEKFDELAKLKQAYEENLRLKAPVAYWEEIASKKKYSFRLWLVVTSVVSFLLVGFVGYLFNLFYSQSSAEISQVIPFSFVVIALIAVLIYAVKTLVKIMMAERHLSTEYEEKAMFTHFYLSLLQNEGIQVTDQERLLIYNALFAPVDTGLIKHQSDTSLGIADLYKTVRY